MKRALTLAILPLAALASGCADNRPDNLDDLGIGSSSASITLNRTHDDWSNGDIDTTYEDQIKEAGYDGVGGFKIEEGTAGLLVMVAVFDGTTNGDKWKALQGNLHLANSAPDVADVQLIENELRRFVVVAKKQGHVDLKVTIDGATGDQTIPIDVVPLTAP